MRLLSLVPLLFGLVLVVVGTLGWLERLPRNRFVGVRTPATLRGDREFRLANKVAGLPIAVAGAVGMIVGAVGLAAGPVIALVGFVGMTVIVIAAGVLGNRAAAAMPEELPAKCRGCECGGCELARSVGASVRPDVPGMGGQ